MTAPSFYVNFEAALTKLKEFKKAYDGSEIHRAGVIQAFEFTFEQCWKAIQKRAGSEGTQLISPKPALQWAMKAGWIDPTSESVWIEMLLDRNLTSHTYRDKTAQEVVIHILNSYEIEFTKILSQMRSS